MSRSPEGVAAEAWDRMNVREKLAALDPDGDREFFVEFMEWCREQRFRGRTVLPQDFLNHLRDAEYVPRQELEPSRGN